MNGKDGHATWKICVVDPWIALERKGEFMDWQFSTLRV
jgi:hypothetical protein